MKTEQLGERTAAASDRRATSKRALLKAGLLTVLATALAGCLGYMPGRQTYWDAKVQEMCAKDGGVVVYEKVRISQDQISRRLLPMTADGKLSFTTKDLAHPDAPIYAVETIVTVNERNPRVTRNEASIVRRKDHAIVAKRVVYSRFGGDFPTGISEASSFVCPDLSRITDELHQRLFKIE